MLIVAGHLILDPSDRDAHVRASAAAVRLARRAPGCRDFAVSADAVDSGRVNVLERWESSELFRSATQTKIRTSSRSTSIESVVSSLSSTSSAIDSVRRSYGQIGRRVGGDPSTGSNTSRCTASGELKSTARSPAQGSRPATKRKLPELSRTRGHAGHGDAQH